MTWKLPSTQPSDIDDAKEGPNNKEHDKDIEAQTQKQVKGSAKVAFYRQRRVQVGVSPCCYY
jgi:hypothetical protein